MPGTKEKGGPASLSIGGQAPGSTYVKFRNQGLGGKQRENMRTSLHVWPAGTVFPAFSPRDFKLIKRLHRRCCLPPCN